MNPPKVVLSPPNERDRGIDMVEDYKNNSFPYIPEKESEACMTANITGKGKCFLELSMANTFRAVYE